MRKKLKIHDKPFESIEEAKSFFLENISKGDEIKKDNAKFPFFFALFVEYCNESSEKKWHVNPEEISHFRFGPTIVDSNKDIVAETNCFWCMFLTEKVDRQFSVEKAIRWKANQ
ncbi:TPA: hypothetical protein ACNIGN_002186 [Proteus mirabilis]|nr:hypothetical protein [Proteus mirabilis]